MIEKRGRRGFIVSDTLVPWIIVVLVIVLGLIAYGIVSGKLQQFFDVIRDFFRGAR
jgi:hypothetical protein